MRRLDYTFACGAFHYATVRGVQAKRVQCDEIWSFCYAKEKNVKAAKAAPFGAASVWTWTAIDAESKLIISYMVGDRDSETANFFMDGVQVRLVAVGGELDAALDPVAHVVERQNLTMRMSMRRFTRLTNGFSKKIDSQLRAPSAVLAWTTPCW